MGGRNTRVLLVVAVLGLAAWATACSVDRGPLRADTAGSGPDASGSGGTGTAGGGDMDGGGTGGSGGVAGRDASVGHDANGLDATGRDAARTDAAVTDSGSDAQNDGGVVSIGDATPGFTTCGGLDCMLNAFPTNVCCVGGPPFPTGCYPTLPGCVNNPIETIECDDLTDCSNGLLCCGTLNGQVLGTTCSATCPAPEFQVCRTGGECPNRRCRPIPEATDYGRCE